MTETSGEVRFAKDSQSEETRKPLASNKNNLVEGRDHLLFSRKPDGSMDASVTGRFAIVVVVLATLLGLAGAALYFF